MIDKRTEHHFKVSVLIMLAIASVGLVFQANIYGQEGSQTLSRAVFLADLEPRAASNSTGIAVFEILGGDTMSYTINAPINGTVASGNLTALPGHHSRARARQILRK
jgi:hypothetical protein